MKKFLILIPIILFGLFLFFARKMKYDAFHKAKINGTIDAIYRYRDYVMLTINQVEFRIIPITFDSEPQLDLIAVEKDSIYKNENSDTLELIHNGIRYLYTVQKH